MEWSSLELKVISCRDLKAFNFLQKQSVYAVVSITSDDPKKKDQQLQRQKTPIDRERGKNPKWNHVMQFDLEPFSPEEDSCNFFLKFNLCCEGIIFGNRNIGKVRVPLKDLIEEFNGAVRFVSYQIRSCDGKPNGVLNFSYKMNGKTGKNGSDSTEINSSLSSNIVSSEKVNYPTLEVDFQSRDICYPSVDDVQFDPLPAGISFLCQKSERQVPELHAMNPSPLQLPPLVVARGAYYHPYALPVVLTSGPYYWYPSEIRGYGYGQGGQSGTNAWMVGPGNGRDGFSLSGTGTTRCRR